MMNGDNPLAGGPLPADGAGSVVAPTTGPSATDPSAVETPDNFQSREELRQWLIQIAEEQWSELFGQKTHRWGWGWYGDIAVFRTALTAAFTTNDVSTASSDSISPTNTQVAGVDEADLVETDGEYLYVVSGKTLTIVKLGVGDELAITARVQLDDDVTGMYLDGDRLALISSRTNNSYGWDGLVRPMIGLFIDVEMAAEPSKDDEAAHHNRPTTTVTLLDVSDRAAPALVKKTELDGRYVASRAVDGQLRLVLENGFHLPQPLARPVEGESEQTNEAPFKATPLIGGELRLMVADYYYPGVMQEYVYETRQEYIDRVIDEMLDNLPRMREIGLDGEVVAEAALVAPDSIVRPDGHEFGALTTIVTIDMHRGGAAEDSASVLANQGATVYATTDHLYLLTQSYDSTGGSGDVLRWWQPTTKIWKFSFGAESHDVQLAARGRADGSLLNQFAVDEHEGHLRVVTSGGWNEGQQLFVLQQTGKRLNVIGQVGGLAPGEVVQSVRFMGERAFVVTFRQVDPLFAIDLSDPENPTVEGELKIPGYSEYLQPLDENHLIGIGRGANEQNGFFEELQVSIFDVTDLDNPRLVHRYSFDGGRSTTTVATGDRWTRGDGDHHAVGYYADEQILTLPIYAADSFAWWDETDDEPLFEHGKGGVQVFRIDADEGLVPAALIEHETLIHRTVLVGDHLFAISPGTVTAHALDDPATALAELQLEADGDFTPLVESLVPPVESSVEVTAALVAAPAPQSPSLAAALVADPPPDSVEDLLPALRDEYAVPESPSLVEATPALVADRAPNSVSDFGPTFPELYAEPESPSVVEVTAALIADAAPNAVRDFRPRLRELYAVPQTPSLAAQFRSGRDAAIALLANRCIFGDFVVLQPSSFVAGALKAVDHAFDDSAGSPAEDVSSESDERLDGVSLTSHLAAQFN